MRAGEGGRRVRRERGGRGSMHMSEGTSPHRRARSITQNTAHAATRDQEGRVRGCACKGGGRRKRHDMQSMNLPTTPPCHSSTCTAMALIASPFVNPRSLHPSTKQLATFGLAPTLPRPHIYTLPYLQHRHEHGLGVDGDQGSDQVECQQRRDHDGSQRARCGHHQRQAHVALQGVAGAEKGVTGAEKSVAGAGKGATGAETGVAGSGKIYKSRGEKGGRCPGHRHKDEDKRWKGRVAVDVGNGTSGEAAASAHARAGKGCGPRNRSSYWTCGTFCVERRGQGGFLLCTVLAAGHSSTPRAGKKIEVCRKLEDIPLQPTAVG
eukprot:353206-Chlamydomonas_euryale.AAC.6